MRWRRAACRAYCLRAALVGGGELGGLVVGGLPLLEAVVEAPDLAGLVVDLGLQVGDLLGGVGLVGGGLVADGLELRRQGVELVLQRLLVGVVLSDLGLEGDGLVLGVTQLAHGVAKDRPHLGQLGVLGVGVLGVNSLGSQYK